MVSVTYMTTPSKRIDEFDTDGSLDGDEYIIVQDPTSKAYNKATISQITSAGGAVDSVNGATGTVVLDADDIDDTSTTHKFVTATDITTLSNTSGTNTGDQDLSSYATTAAVAASYQPLDADLTALAALTTPATKLDGIEAGADVTDTANVTAAGALMDSEVTNLAQVKAFSSADYATAAQGALADSAVQPGDLATVATTGAYSDLSGTPTLGTAAAKNIPATGDASATEVVYGTDTRLTDARTPTSHTHPTTDLTATGGTSTSFLRKDNTWATPTNTTYSEITTAEIDAGTASTLRTVTGRRAGYILGKAYARANHTGTQTASTISDFDTAVAANSAVAANTAKISFDSTASSKLAGIEALADVTDATNVDAAGAVMNSDTTTASMSFVVDEDDMASDSATKVPTQQSTKAYVDATNVPARNLLLNSQFKGTSYGTSAVTLSTGGGPFFADRWRGKYHEASSSATMTTPIDTYDGGTTLTLTNTVDDYFYFRQTIPGIMQFEGKTYTARVETGTVASGLNYDFYVNARPTTNDVDRLNIVDSGQSSLASDSVYTYTFTVPSLSSLAARDSENGLEFAFRVNSPTAHTGSTVEIKSIALYEGEQDWGVPYSDTTYERPIWDQWHDSYGFTVIGGMDATSGQKRATFFFTARQRKETGYTLTYRDAAGTAGKVSTYNAAGTRTDGATPTAISRNAHGFTVIINSSTAVGIGCEYEMSSED